MRETEKQKPMKTICMHVGKALIPHKKALICKLNSMLNCMESACRPEGVVVRAQMFRFLWLFLRRWRRLDRTF